MTIVVFLIVTGQHDNAAIGNLEKKIRENT